MGFRIIDPRRKVKKAKAGNSQEVLDRLEEFLSSAEVTGEPVEVLCGFWEDQQNAISYQELREAVQDGGISWETLQLWAQDYYILVAGKLSKMWENAIKAGPSGQPVLDGLKGFSADTHTPKILKWIDDRGAAFVTACTEEQKNAISALLTKKMRDGHTVDELARLIRPCIGLTEGDAKAVARHYDNIVATLKKEHPRMKPESIKKKALDAAQKNAERKHRARAMTIARTECAFAYNRGADEVVRQAQEQGYLGKMKKRWSTSGDDRVCSTCNALEGMEVDMDVEFKFPGKILFPGHHLLPPAHPRCACAIEYIEEEPAGMFYGGQQLGAGDNKNLPGMEEETPMEKLGEIDPGKTEEALVHYGNLFRNDTVENVVVIDKAGNVYHSAGDTSNVGITGIDLAGASITHNHPQSNGIVSFGEADFQFMKENPDIAVMEAVNKYFTYSAVPLDKIKEISYNEIYREAIIRGIETAEEDLQHLAMEVLAEKRGVIYGRKAVK